MSTQCPNGLLPAKTDIEGIGTRIATYTQLFFAVFILALSPNADSFSAWWALLVTSIALQLATIVHRDEMTLFHAVVVTWLAYPVFAISWVYLFLHWRVEYMATELMLMTYLHGFFFIGFGFWIWSTAASFGICPETNATLQFVMLGKTVHPLGWIRVFVLIIYSSFTILFLLGSFAEVINTIPPFRRLAREKLKKFHITYSHRLMSISAYIPSRTNAVIIVTLYNLFNLALTIWSVESLLIRNVTGSSRADESAWSFGQLSAMFLLAVPAFSLGKIMKDRFWTPDKVENPGNDISEDILEETNSKLSAA